MTAAPRLCPLQEDRPSALPLTVTRSSSLRGAIATPAGIWPHKEDTRVQAVEGQQHIEDPEASFQHRGCWDVLIHCKCDSSSQKRYLAGGGQLYVLDCIDSDAYCEHSVSPRRFAEYLRHPVLLVRTRLPEGLQEHCHCLDQCDLQGAQVRKAHDMIFLSRTNKDCRELLNPKPKP